MSCIIDIFEIQPKSVRYDTEARKAHCRRCEHGVKLPAKKLNIDTCGKRDTNNIIDKRPEQILMNVAQDGSAQSYRRRDIGESALHQYDICRVNCNIRACADCNTRIGRSKRRSVVYAVTHHCYLAALFQLIYRTRLAVGKHSCYDLVNACLCSDSLCSALIITRKHYHAYSHVFQFINSLAAFALNYIGNRNNTEQSAVFRKEHRSLALV